MSGKGHAGGWRLARDPQAISLADVYLALGERLVSGDAPAQGLTHCSVETGLHQRVAAVLEEVEQSLVKRLGETSIADVHSSECSFCTHDH